MTAYRQGTYHKPGLSYVVPLDSDPQEPTMLSSKVAETRFRLDSTYPVTVCGET